MFMEDALIFVANIRGIGYVARYYTYGSPIYFIKRRSLENDFVGYLLRYLQIASTHFSPTARHLFTYHFRVLRKIKIPLHGTCVKRSFNLFGRVIFWFFLADDHHALFVQYSKTENRLLFNNRLILMSVFSPRPVFIDRGLWCETTAVDKLS